MPCRLWLPDSEAHRTTAGQATDDNTIETLLTVLIPLRVNIVTLLHSGTAKCTQMRIMRSGLSPSFGSLGTDHPLLREFSAGDRTKNARNTEQSRRKMSRNRTVLPRLSLLLGRHPHPEEWRGHAMRAGDDLNGVVSSFAGSLECAQRGLVRGSLHTDTSPGAPILTALEGFVLFSDPDDASVGSAVRAGSYEPEICTQFRRLLSPGMCVLDIGANIGFFAMLSAGLVGASGHVVAVEPNPRNVRLLESSRRKNGFTNMTVLQIAAGRANGLLALNTSYQTGQQPRFLLMPLWFGLRKQCRPYASMGSWVKRDGWT